MKGKALAADASSRTDAPGPPPRRARPRVAGKLLFAGAEKLLLRGLTYGPFRPDDEGQPYPAPELVEQDVARMAALGFNALRTFTAPPRWLLDAADRHGLWVLVGLAWETHVAVLDDRARAADVERRVRLDVRACAGHPAVLGYAVGNEVPASIVRWHGPRRVERFLGRLLRAARAEDPEALVAYASYPTTEYLDLPLADLVCFNVYVESERRLETYLHHLHTLAGDRPLVVGEIGLDALRHGADGQARLLPGLLRTTFASGCAGAFVFSWTDDWHRGGLDVEGWAFGLTDRQRQPRPALAAVAAAVASVPPEPATPRPSITVAVCTHDGARTLAECLEGVGRLRYPCYEVVVVDDGSTDATASIASRFACRLLRTPHRGLAAARNAALEAARGEVVAYLDDDAYPDPDWLSYLASTLAATSHVAVGGPNLPPPGDGLVADCVAHAPGGPTHVLLDGSRADHLPGCNMAFRVEGLRAIGGFDPRFRAAGDDVDVCWRLQERGWTLGFNPAAVVWHHRRGTLRGYLRQQRGYGRAEALLERKWPARYNSAGHLDWGGRLYGPPGWGSSRVRYGTWGGSLFQSRERRPPGLLAALPFMPEWSLLVGLAGTLALLGLVWPPLLAALPAFVLAAAAPLALAASAALHAPLRHPSRAERLRRRVLIALLHLLQPAARLAGRWRGGLVPWRRRGLPAPVPPWPRETAVWSERWQPAEAWLGGVERKLAADGAAVRRGGAYDRWELEVRGGAFGVARLRAAVEEHGSGRQLLRFRVWPRWSRTGGAVCLALGPLAGLGALAGAWAATAALLGLLALLGLAAAVDGGGALAALLGALPSADSLTERADRGA